MLYDQQLKKALIAAWREIDDDKALCRHFMASLPHRLQAVIDKEGRQIQKEDYKSFQILKYICNH